MMGSSVLFTKVRMTGKQELCSGKKAPMFDICFCLAMHKASSSTSFKGKIKNLAQKIQHFNS